MGAGAVAGHAKDSETSCGQTSPVSSNKHTSSQYSSQSILATKSQMKMSCEVCSVNFSIFKRKKFCQECRRYFCSNCLPKPPSNSMTRQCNKCKLLVSGRFSRDDLQGWKVKDMTCFLNARNISTKECREKHDLIELVLAQFCKQPRLSLQDQEEHENLVKRMAAHVQKVSSNNESMVNGRDGPSTSTHSNSPPPLPPLISETQSDPPAEDETSGRPSQEASEAEFEINAERLEEFFRESVERLREAWGRAEESSQAQEEDHQSSAVRRTHIDDITSAQSIEELSIRQLKELLVNNFVDYRGCCEKPELIARVKRLWSDHQANKAKAEKIHKEEEQAYYGNTLSQHFDECVKEAPSETAEAPQSSSSEIPESDQAADPATATPPSNQAEAAANAGKQIEDSLCHICMDSLVDCILLECGHMVTCTQCGKRLADCPICRQYIVRVVRVFRS